MALALFCSVLGAVAGNLGLMVLATGGVFVAGGIAPRVLPYLQRGGFREAFERKGRLHTMVERMPAYVVTHRNRACSAQPRSRHILVTPTSSPNALRRVISGKYGRYPVKRRPPIVDVRAMASGPHGARATR